jgi:hypothetical protein
MANSTVNITYERSGTTPPIFVAGSFTEPAWQPIELDHQQVNDEYVFSKTFDITPGTHQYKFRIGLGDWWVCDDTKDKGSSILLFSDHERVHWLMKLLPDMEIPAVLLSTCLLHPVRSLFQQPERLYMRVLTNRVEIDGAGNVNNALKVQSHGSSDLGQLEGEPATCDRGAESSTKTASEHRKSPSLGLDGVDDSDEELARSLRKQVALTEKTMAEFRGANGDIEPDDSGMDMAERGGSKSHNASNAPVNGSATQSKEVPFAENAPAPESRANAATKTSAETSEPTHKVTKVQDGEEKVLPHKPSVSTISARNGQKDQKDFWLSRFCRVVVQGVVGSMSTLLWGKRRK